MNGTPDNIIVNSCELTPVYLIQESGVAQTKSYVLTPANQVEQKPVSNLKRFYESSGNLDLEQSILLNNSEISKPRILKKPEGTQKGNNLKLASFLVPKTSASIVQSSTALVQNTASLVQNGASIMQNNGTLGQSSASIVQNSLPIVQNNASLVQNSATIVQNNASLVPNSATIVQNNVSLVQNSATIVQNNVSLVQNSATIVQSSPSIVQNSALIVQNKPVQPVLFKPVSSTATVPATTTKVGRIRGTIPKIDMDRKIVKLKPSDTKPRHFQPRPKNKPKEVIPPPPELPKYTSVQLLKLGETYHSLNVLSDNQVKMVNQALNIIKDPEKIPTEPAYDPVTNTRFIYKIVSPKDLKVVGKNKVLMKETNQGLEVFGGVMEDFEGESRVPLTVTTRSGRKVKNPRQTVEEEAPQKPRKRPGTIVSCSQCSTDFGSLYQLQKHYDSNPTHAPAKVHSTLFHCLLAIVTSSPAEARAKLFLQQLEQLVHKLRALLPCLLQAGKDKCSIGEDVGSLFGVNPGKYNINIDALNCVKDKEGHCKHNPPPPKPIPVVNQFSTDVNKPSQFWLSKHNEEIANIEESDDCARINTAHKWPTVGNKLWNIKQKTQKNYVKKMRLASENNEALIDLGQEDLTAFTTLTADECPMSMPQKMVSLLQSENEPVMQDDINDTQDSLSFEDTLMKSKNSHIQFHSAHFDIRSSPIKPSSTVFRKFQINPERIEKLNVQIIRPLSLDQKPDEINEITNEITPTTSDCSKLDSIFRDEIEMTCKDVINNELSFDSSKNWAISSASNDGQSHENYMKSNAVIEPSLIHVKDVPIDGGMDSGLTYSDMAQNTDMRILDDSNDNPDNHDKLSLSQNQSVLNFLETLGNECLTYPEEPEIRNTSSVDFQLDLFSFNNT